MCLFLIFFFWGFETTDTLKGDLNLNLIYIQFSQQSFFSLRHRKRIKKDKSFLRQTKQMPTAMHMTGATFTSPKIKHLYFYDSPCLHHVFRKMSLVKVGRGGSGKSVGFLTHLSLPGPAWPFPVCIVLHAQQNWLYHMIADQRVQQNSSKQRNFSQQRMEQVTRHSTTEEQLPSQLIKACPQQAPLSPTLLPIQPCCPPYSTPPDCYLDTQRGRACHRAWDRNSRSKFKWRLTLPSTQTNLPAGEFGTHWPDLMVQGSCALWQTAALKFPFTSKVCGAEYQ